MEERLNYVKASPGAVKAMAQLQAYLNDCGLERSLVELVKTRASQINGCAFCIHTHTQDALKYGEKLERLFLLDAWEESPIYTSRERAALALTEAVTKVTEGHVPDAVYAMARSQFNEKELADLVVTITTINAWNRISITFWSLPRVESPAE